MRGIAVGQRSGSWPSCPSGRRREGRPGKLSGRVVDAEGNPIVAATVHLVGHGAFTDPQGKYNVLNISPGTYEVSVSRLGYETVLVQEVAVSADKTTWLDVNPPRGQPDHGRGGGHGHPAPGGDQRHQHPGLRFRGRDRALPVQELEDVVNLQAGVVDGHFREAGPPRSSTRWTG